MRLHPIPPNLWCIPSAIAALTGADVESVIHPALNRHTPRAESLTGMVVSASIEAARNTLEEMGYRTRAYRGRDPLHSRVEVWANRSHKYSGQVLFICTATHALVIQDGRVYDNHAPHGPVGKEHPFAKTRVTDVFLVEKRR